MKRDRIDCATRKGGMNRRRIMTRISRTSDKRRLAPAVKRHMKHRCTQNRNGDRIGLELFIMHG